MPDERSHRAARAVLTAAVVAIPLVAPPLLHAVVTRTFTGGNNGTWSVAGNWNPSGIPQAGDSAYLNIVSISPGNLVYDGNASLNTLTLDSVRLAVNFEQQTSGHNLNATNEIIGDTTRANYFQSASTNTVSNLYLGNTLNATGFYSLFSSAAHLQGNDEHIGYAGSGTFVQSAGTNNAGFRASLGELSGSFGTYTLSSLGALTSGSTWVGGQGVGAFVQTGGSHSTGSLYIPANSGTGSYTLSAGSLQALQSLYVGSDGGTGLFTQTGGSVAAYLNFAIDTRVGSSAYSLSGTGSLTTESESIGSTGSGTFMQSGGTHAATVALSIGVNSGSNGLYSLSGTGRLTTRIDYIGDFGIGTFMQTGGTHAVTTDLILGLAAGGVGGYQLAGSASLTVGGNLSIGSAAGGTGWFQINSGVASVTGAVNIYPGSSLAIFSPGALNLAATVPLTWNYSFFSPIDTLRNDLRLGLITSSQVSGDPNHRLAIAYSATSSAVSTRLAYLGDINFDGKVNADDYATLDRSVAIGNFDPHWIDGDFNYDGVLTSADYALIDRSYLLQGSPPSSDFLSLRESQFGDDYVQSLLASVPEPSWVGVLGLPIFSRRSRHRLARC